MKLILGCFGFFGDRFCEFFHGRPMWPTRGRYVCPKCLRGWEVSWEVKPDHETRTT